MAQRYSVPTIFYCLDRVYVNQMMDSILENGDNDADKCRQDQAPHLTGACRDDEDRPVEGDFITKNYMVSMAMIPIFDNRFINVTVRFKNGESAKEKHFKAGPWCPPSRPR